MRRHALTLFGLWALTALAYGAVWSQSFVYEDWQWPIEAVRWSQIASIRPDEWLLTALWSANPRWVHAVNLAVHCVNIALLYGLLVRWGAKSPAFLAGLFAVHPLAVEAVAYGSGRSEALTVSWCLLAAWLASERLTIVRLLALVLVAWLAVSTKQTGVVVVGIVALVWWVRRPVLLARMVINQESINVVAISGTTMTVARRSDGTVSPRMAFWVLSVLILLAMRGLPELFDRNAAALVGWVEWWRWEAISVVSMLRLLVWPVGFAIEHDPMSVALVWQTVALIGCAVILEVLTGVVVFERAFERRSVTLPWIGLAWMAIVVLPRFLLIMPSAPFNEHHAYGLLPGAVLLLGKVRV